MLSHIWGIFSFSSFPAWRPRFQSWGPNLSLNVKILAKRPRSWPWGPKLSLQARIWALRLGFGPWGWDLGLKTGIWALRLKFGPRDWDLRGVVRRRRNSRKSVRWSAVPVPCLSRLGLKLRERAGQRPRRGRWPMLSHIWGIFSFSFSSSSVPPPQIPVSRPKFQSRGPNPSLEAHIPASRPKS